MDSDSMLKILKETKAKADASFELRFTEDTFTTIAFKNAEAVGVKSGRHSNMVVRCIRDGKIVYLESDTGSSKKIQDMLNGVYSLATYSCSKPDSQKSFSSDSVRHIRPTNPSLNDDDLRIGTEEIKSHARRLGGFGLIISSMRYGNRKVSMANTNGISADWSTPYARLSTRVTLGSGEESSFAARTQQSTGFKQRDIRGLIDDAFKNAASALKPKPIKSFKGSMLLSKDVAASFLRATVYALCANSIIDRKSFLTPLAETTGREIAPPFLSIHENNSIKDSPFSRNFDDELSGTSSKTLVKGGKVGSILHSIYTAERTGAKPTGNMFYDAKATVGNMRYGGIFTTNAVLKCASNTYSEEELIGNIKEGIYVLSASGSPYPSGKPFSLKVSGYYIKNGSIVHPVRDITMNGNLPDMLKRVAMAGNGAERIIEAVTPMLLIDDVSIYGK